MGGPSAWLMWTDLLLSASIGKGQHPVFEHSRFMVDLHLGVVGQGVRTKLSRHSQRVGRRAKRRELTSRPIPDVLKPPNGACEWSWLMPDRSGVSSCSKSSFGKIRTVDPDRACVDLLCDAHSPRKVLGEDGRGETLRGKHQPKIRHSTSRQPTYSVLLACIGSRQHEVIRSTSRRPTFLTTSASSLNLTMTTTGPKISSR